MSASGGNVGIGRRLPKPPIRSNGGTFDGDNRFSARFERRFHSQETRMIGRAAPAILAVSLAAGTALAQTTPSPGDASKAETSCTTTGAATSGSGGQKDAKSLAMEKSAILPSASGHANSAAPTVQSDGKPMEVRKDCPPDGKAKS
jgi:hypothetical protein